MASIASSQSLLLPAPSDMVSFPIYASEGDAVPPVDTSTNGDSSFSEENMVLHSPPMIAPCPSTGYDFLSPRKFVDHNYQDHSLDIEEDYRGQTAFDGADEEADGVPDKISSNGQAKGTPTSTKSPKSKKRKQTFPDILHDMLQRTDDEGLSSVVSWQPHGRAFCVHKPRQFVETIMPQYFRQSKITSFQRQLNLYGFRRLTLGPDTGSYYHELFLRGKPFLCKKMIRTKIKGHGFKASNNPDAEPDFYKMPPVPTKRTGSVGGSEPKSETPQGQAAAGTTTTTFSHAPVAASQSVAHPVPVSPMIKSKQSFSAYTVSTLSQQGRRGHAPVPISPFPGSSAEPQDEAVLLPKFRDSPETVAQTTGSMPAPPSNGGGGEPQDDNDQSGGLTVSFEGMTFYYLDPRDVIVDQQLTCALQAPAALKP